MYSTCITGNYAKYCFFFVLHDCILYDYKPVHMRRSFAKPPSQVQTVCECIVALRGYKEINWKTAKGMMADTNFLNSLQNMDVDGISQGQVLVVVLAVVTLYPTHMRQGGKVIGLSVCCCHKNSLIWSFRHLNKLQRQLSYRKQKKKNCFG